MNDACSSLTQVLATVDEKGNVKQTYQRGLGLISYSESLGDEGNETIYYVSDGRGSVTALLKEGSITDRYHYDAYGNLIKKSGSSENEYLYNGESYSETTGLYYQRARYMNPTTGTFISMDAYNGTTDNPVSQHKYLYPNANPVMYEDPRGYMSMMEMQVSMTMHSILMGGISNMFYVSLSNDAQENGMSIGEMLEAFAVGAIYTMLGLIVALLFEILCPALLILGIILSPFIVLYNGHNAMRQAQALGEDRQAAFCYITTILGSLAAAVGGPRAAFDLMDYRMSNGIPRQGNAGQGCVGDESAEICNDISTASNVRTRIPRSNGHWSGEPGESIWYSDIDAVNQVTGGEGIPFTNGRPVFSEWSAGELVFDEGILNGTQDDFGRVYGMLRLQSEGGFTSNNMVRQFLRDSGLTPHHSSTTVIQLIPSALHGNILHIGAASDLRGGF